MATLLINDQQFDDPFEITANYHISCPGIYFGDTVHVVNEVLELQPNGRRRGRVVWKRSLLNQRQEVVQEGILETVVTVAKSPETKS